MSVLLVRHASAEDRSTSSGEDRLRPLDDKGRRQAVALIEHLDGYPLTSVMSSPALRCVSTVGPLAAARNLTVRLSDSLAEANERGALDLIQPLAGTDCLVCTHGDNIPFILWTFVVDYDLDLGPEPEWRKASAWVLQSAAGRFVRATYLPPPV